MSNTHYDYVNIDEIVTPFVKTNHTWNYTNNFKNGTFLTKTELDSKSDDTIASTEYVNKAITNYNTDNNTSNYSVLIPLLSDHIIESKTWILSDANQQFSKDNAIDGVEYDKIYKHLISDIETGIEKTETIDNITISFTLAKDGHKIVDGTVQDNVDNLNNLFKSTGQAWYFVIYKNLKKFNLPKSKNYIKCIDENSDNDTSTYSKGIDHIPNISGKLDFGSHCKPTNLYGCFKNGDIREVQFSEGFTETVPRDIQFDASCSNSVYGASDGIDIANIHTLLYFSTGYYDEKRIPSTSINACLNSGIVTTEYDVDINSIKSDTIINAYTTKNNSYIGLELGNTTGIVQVYNKNESDEYYVGNIDNTNTSLGVLHLGITEKGSTICLKSTDDLIINDDSYLTIKEYEIVSDNLRSNGIRCVDFSTKTTHIDGYSFEANSLYFESDGYVTIELHGDTPNNFFIQLDNKTIVNSNQHYDSILSFPITRNSNLSWSSSESQSLYITINSYSAKICHTPRSTEKIIGRKTGVIPVCVALKGQQYYKGQYISYSNILYTAINDFVSTGDYLSDAVNLSIFTGNLPEYSYAIYEHENVLEDGTTSRYHTVKMFIRQKFSNIIERPKNDKYFGIWSVSIPFPVSFKDDVYNVKCFSTITPPQNSSNDINLHYSIDAASTGAEISVMPVNDIVYPSFMGVDTRVSTTDFYIYVIADGQIS